MTIEENVPLAPFTTFRIGGAARFFVRAKSVEEVVEAFDFAKKNNLKIFVLGGGSNILVSDAGFDGLVIKNEIKGIAFDEDDCKVTVGAGENWDELVAVTVEKGLYGLENLSLIPGTVGAAPVQNIGAYGSEVKDTILSVGIYDPEKGVIGVLSAEQCAFGYRDSIFKHEFKHAVITSVVFKLNKNGAVNIEYKDLKNYFVEHKVEPTLQNVRKAVVEIRTNKLPDVKNVGTAGSFFKNAIITKEDHAKLLEKYPEIPTFPVDEKKVKVSTAWMIDKICGFKGLRRGAVGIYETQALVLVNFGGGTAAEVQSLAQEMIDSIKEKTGITIEREVEVV